MKKINKPASKTPAKKASTTKQSAAKPKAKSSAKPKPRKAQGQAELLPIVERLAQSAERLAQAAERLAETARRPSPVAEQQDEALRTPEDLVSNLPGSEEPTELADPGDLRASEGHVQEDSAPDFAVPGAYPAILDPPKDE